MERTVVHHLRPLKCVPNGGAVLQTAVLVCSRLAAMATLGVVQHDLLAVAHDLRADDESRPDPLPARLTASRPLTHRPSAATHQDDGFTTAES